MMHSLVLDKSYDLTKKKKKKEENRNKKRCQCQHPLVVYPFKIYTCYLAGKVAISFSSSPAPAPRKNKLETNATLKSTFTVRL